MDDDKVKARKAETPIAYLPPMPITSSAIQLIAARGQEDPSKLSLTEVFHLCDAIVSASKT